MQLNSPIGASKVDRLIDILNLTPESTAVDFGCGDGNFVIRLNQTSGATCLGLDISEALIASANSKLDDIPDTNIQFRQSDAAGASLDEGSFDLAVCMGSSHAFCEGEPAYRSALEAMTNLLKPQGMILIGEPYWKKEPDSVYLEFLGDPVGIYNSFEANISVAESFGLVPMYATESTPDEWDHFEWSFRIKAERDLITHPNDDELRKKRDNVREWNAMYRKYGRFTMGYAHYIFMKG